MRARRLLILVCCARAVEWTVDPLTTRAYALVKSSTFASCVKQCDAINASLPCLRSRHESNFLNEQFDDTFWLGLYQAKLCTWASVSGCASDFDDWIPGTPDNKRGIENCAQHTDTGWNDVSCGHLSPCICERGLTATQETIEWEGPKLHFGIQGRRSTNRDATYALAIVSGLLASLLCLMNVVASENCSQDSQKSCGKSGRVVLMAFKFGFIPGLLFLMAVFLGSHDANCRDDPVSLQAMGFSQVALGCALLLVARMITCWSRMHEERIQAESAQRAEARRVKARKARVPRAKSNQVTPWTQG